MNNDDNNILADSRFEHLLRPLKDMADNWEVDIASVLEQYLDILDGLSFSFSEEDAANGIAVDPTKKFNFAEAAYIIQGSGCVYSKKVEYLYNLAAQALQYVQMAKK